MNCFTIPLLLFSITAHTASGFYPDFTNSKETDTPNDDPNCYCYPNEPNLPKINELLDPEDEGLERLVLYIYKKVGNNEIKLYVPGINKQVHIPDLPYENTDQIIEVTDPYLANIFIYNPSKIKVNKNSIDVVPNNAPIGWIKGSVEIVHSGEESTTPIRHVEIVTTKPIEENNENNNNSPQISAAAVIAGQEIPSQHEVKAPTITGSVIATPVQARRELDDPHNNLKVSFNAWFDQQIHNFQGPPYDISTINKVTVKHLVRNTLAKHNFTVSPNGIIQDTTGEVVNPALLELRPFLIGDKVSYQLLQTSFGTDVFPKNLPYLEGILLIYVHPYQVLGVIPLGKTYLTQNSLLHRVSQNLQVISQPVSISSILRSQKVPTLHSTAGQLGSSSTLHYHHPKLDTVPNYGTYDIAETLTGNVINPSYYYPIRDTSSISGTNYWPYSNYYYNGDTNTQPGSYPSVDTVFNPQSISYPNVENVLLDVQYPTIHSAPSQRTYTVGTIKNVHNPSFHLIEPIHLLPHKASHTPEPAKLVPHSSSYTVDAVNTVPHRNPYSFESINPGSYSLGSENTVLHPDPESYSVETVKAVPHRGSYSLDVEKTIIHPSLYSIDTKNHPKTYTVETDKIVPHSSSYTVDTENPVLSPSSYPVDTISNPKIYSIETIKTVPHRRPYSLDGENIGLYPNSYLVDTSNHPRTYTVEPDSTVPYIDPYSLNAENTGLHPSSYAVETSSYPGAYTVERDNTVPHTGSHAINNVENVPLVSSYAVETGSNYPASYHYQISQKVPTPVPIYETVDGVLGSHKYTVVDNVPHDLLLSNEPVDNLPVDSELVTSDQTGDDTPSYLVSASPSILSSYDEEKSLGSTEQSITDLGAVEETKSGVKIEHYIGVPKLRKVGSIKVPEELEDVNKIHDNHVTKKFTLKYTKKSPHISPDSNGIADIVSDSEIANDGEGLDFRIIGGSAATGSGTPLSNKGRSGYLDYV